MMTREFTRLTQRIGSVVAVAAVVAFVGGTVTIAANDKDHKDYKDEKKDVHKKVWRKVNICHVDKDGHGHLIEISEEAEAQHIAHGDGHPGDRWSRHRRYYRWTRECKDVPELPPPPPPPPAPKPPAPPTPPPDPVLSCVCWEAMKQSQVLSILQADSTPAQSICVVNESTVSLSPDDGIGNQLLVLGFGQCLMRVNGQDSPRSFTPLSGEETTACMAEGRALVPSVKYCPQ